MVVSPHPIFYDPLMTKFVILIIQYSVIIAYVLAFLITVI